MKAAYYRAMRRVERRAKAYRADPSLRNEALLRQACHVASFLALNSQA